MPLFVVARAWPRSHALSVTYATARVVVGCGSPWALGTEARRGAHWLKTCGSKWHKRVARVVASTVIANCHGHTEALLGGGVRLMLDTESGIASFGPSWQPAVGQPRAAVAFHVW